MNDDRGRRILPRATKVLGKHHPRIVDGVDTFTGETLGPEKSTLEGAEALSDEHRRQRSRSLFTDPMWPVDQVVSWIGHRNIDAIEEPFAPALYKNSRPIVEAKPRIALLRALQEGRLRAIRQRARLVDRVHPDEWAHVRREWPIDRWHECLLAKADVVALWPEMAPVVNHEQECGDETRFSGERRKAIKGKPWRIENFNLLKTWINEQPMPQGLDRASFELELKLRYGAVDRKLSRKLHQDPLVHPGRPGMGPHKSAKSLGNK